MIFEIIVVIMLLLICALLYTMNANLAAMHRGLRVMYALSLSRKAGRDD